MGASMNNKLLNEVLEQIRLDVESGDMTAIAELIADVPDKKAKHFLPEHGAVWEGIEA